MGAQSPASYSLGASASVGDALDEVSAADFLCKSFQLSYYSFGLTAHLYLITRNANMKLTSFKLLQGIDEAEETFLHGHIQFRDYERGERLIQEGEQSDDLVFILDGSVDLVKGDGRHEIVVAEQAEGAVLGEMSFLDSSPRSVSVVAKNVVKAAILPRSVFVEEEPQSQRLLHLIERNIALVSTQRLRETTDEFGQSLKREVDLLKQQVDFGTLFIVMVLLFGLNGVIVDFIQARFSDYYYYESDQYSFLYERPISWVGFLIFMVPALYLVRAIDFPILSVVDVRINFRRTMIESTTVSLIIVVVAALLTLGITPVEGVPQVNENFTWEWAVVVFTPDYLLHCYVQELVARGIMQNAIQRFLQDERGHKTILACSLAFAVMHVHLGVEVALASGIGGVVFGYLYLHQKNLLGVTLIHWVIGMIVVRYLPVLAMLQD